MNARGMTLFEKGVMVAQPLCQQHVQRVTR
ncbi:hypothetical protein WP8S18E11_11840 [Aeromonas veronii]|nr:hypothetical protein WP8S18E11_11840 [Aeromonas veronii]